MKLVDLTVVLNSNKDLSENCCYSIYRLPSNVPGSAYFKLGAVTTWLL